MNQCLDFNNTHPPLPNLQNHLRHRCMIQNYNGQDFAATPITESSLVKWSSSILLIPQVLQFGSWDILHKREFVSEEDSTVRRNICPVALGYSTVCSIRNLPTGLPLVSRNQHTTGEFTLWRTGELDGCVNHRTIEPEVREKTQAQVIFPVSPSLIFIPREE